MAKHITTGLGALTGLVGLLAMVRLVTGAFPGTVSALAWGFVLAAMAPWVAYVAWRARHARWPRPAVFAVALVDAVALISVWLFTLGPVIALAGSLVAFGIIWVHDWPRLGGGTRRPDAADARLVRFEDLVADRAD